MSEPESLMDVIELVDNHWTWVVRLPTGRLSDRLPSHDEALAFARTLCPNLPDTDD